MEEKKRQVMVPHKLTKADRKDLLARIDNLVEVNGGEPSHGRINLEREDFRDQWTWMRSQEKRLRDDILELKGKELEVLDVIRNRVATNLMDTLDRAVSEGAIQPPSRADN